MKIRPFDGETLISFLSRASRPGRLGWSTFLRETTGTTFRNARLAERRTFDLERISSRLYVEVAELKESSERALFPSEVSDEQVIYLAPRHFPWLKGVGYSTYNPIHLSQRQYLRRRWLQPIDLVDEESGTVNLYHCPVCGVRLADHAASMAVPLCPACGARYDRGPKLPASPEALSFQWKLRDRFGLALAARPLNPRCPELMSLAMAWRTAEVLNGQPALQSLAEHFVREAGLGTLRSAEIRRRRPNVGQLAERHIQLLAAGIYVATYFPVIARRHASFYDQVGQFDVANDEIARALIELDDRQYPTLKLTSNAE